MRENELKIPRGVSPEVTKIISPWVDGINDERIICDGSETPESNYAHVVKSLLMRAFGMGGNGRSDEYQMKGLKESAQYFLDNYGSEVMGLMDPEIRKALGIDI
jgi:hypothetical protein